MNGTDWNISFDPRNLMRIPKQNIVHRFLKNTAQNVIPTDLSCIQFPIEHVDQWKKWLVPPFVIQYILAHDGNDLKIRPQMELGLNWTITCNWIMEPEIQWTCILNLTDDCSSPKIKRTNCMELYALLDTIDTKARDMAYQSGDRLPTNRWF